ncbi:hypothetical protein FV232_21400 [Methylobacterium sp. WL30]|jgi:regulator of protease activity HflC (stomatin/prohibitin superfamily)|uniref:hypothetical protein n=1 Tax=unclassified Methylobacterium TaxID=2615210 RepID=UPI0011CB5640|nr:MULTISPECIES: hypothetical protein [unclassified Methylobacterium]TXM91437.1 hypothetical protein FV223_15235 [Methylobacterium sp. WL116]TXN36541.1 hypothetical protein FV225_14540 [Methylobacterium sp. WL93]TXN46361.1 hypothetical protein FV227_23545 [Methylobacterium sp. WL119]TXN64216.1 hypothetical protein FV232_21400 [Methylobacterium sp. WL30]
MSAAAQPRAVDAHPDGHDPEPNDAWRTSTKWAAEALLDDKIVPLFTEPGVPVPQEARGEPNAVDWPAAIDLIRDVGARVRQARDFAQEVSRHSQSIIQRSVKQAEDAERRAEAAEATAAVAILRANQADELARLSEARAKLAEQQAETAKAAEAEAQLWLRRIHACLKDELGDLTVDYA